jgi:transcriptional regulator with GAF, ATPase, and Fis domain
VQESAAGEDLVVMPDLDASYFARLSQELMQQGQEDATVQAVVKRAVDVVPGCEMAGVSLRRKRGRVETVASTDGRVDACDALQYELEEGPCLDAIWQGDTYLANDLRHDQRWATWGPRVADRGMGAIIAVRIADARDAMGALNLYATEVGAFDRHALDVATVFGYHAANALVSAHVVDGLESSLRSRHAIGLAQGILMQKYGLTVDSSFTVMQRYSNHYNVRLRDLADQIIERQDLPPADPERRPPG